MFYFIHRPHTKFTTEHYNELLQVYMANKRTLNVNNFIQQMAPMKPNITTYELILQVLAEVCCTHFLSTLPAYPVPYCKLYIRLQTHSVLCTRYSYCLGLL